MKQIQMPIEEPYNPIDDMTESEYEALADKNDYIQGEYDDYMENQRKQRMEEYYGKDYSAV